MAYVILKTGGKQYKVAEGDLIDVEKLDVEAGQETTFSEVIFHADGDKHTHGAPHISGATVIGEVVEQRKAARRSSRSSTAAARVTIAPSATARS